jgi:hypothetical protein
MNPFSETFPPRNCEPAQPEAVVADASTVVAEEEEDLSPFEARVVKRAKELKRICVNELYQTIDTLKRKLERERATYERFRNSPQSDQSYVYTHRERLLASITKTEQELEDVKERALAVEGGNEYDTFYNEAFKALDKVQKDRLAANKRKQDELDRRHKKNIELKKERDAKQAEHTQMMINNRHRFGNNPRNNNKPKERLISRCTQPTRANNSSIPPPTGKPSGKPAGNSAPKRARSPIRASVEPVRKERAPKRMLGSGGSSTGSSWIEASHSKNHSQSSSQSSSKNHSKGNNHLSSLSTAKVDEEPRPKRVSKPTKATKVKRQEPKKPEVVRDGWFSD